MARIAHGLVHPVHQGEDAADDGEDPAEVAAANLGRPGRPSGPLSKARSDPAAVHREHGQEVEQPQENRFQAIDHVEERRVEGRPVDLEGRHQGRQGQHDREVDRRAGQRDQQLGTRRSGHPLEPGDAAEQVERDVRRADPVSAGHQGMAEFVEHDRAEAGRRRTPSSPALWAAPMPVRGGRSARPKGGGTGRSPPPGPISRTIAWEMSSFPEGSSPLSLILRPETFECSKIGGERRTSFES